MSAFKNNNVGSKTSNFEEIALGDEEKKMIKLFGAGESSLEVYPEFKYKVLSYSKASEGFDIFFTIDPKSNRIVGKSKWIEQNDHNFNLENLLNKEFKEVHFKSYTPCRTRSVHDKILINPDLGLYLATEGQQVVLISYVTKDLLVLRVDLIQKNCPNLQ